MHLNGPRSTTNKILCYIVKGKPESYEYTKEVSWFIIILVLSIRFEEDCYLGKATAGEKYEKQFSSCYPITSIQKELATNGFFLVTSVNISLLYNNCLTDRFISDQNLPFANMQACSLSFTQKVLWKAIWLLVTKNWVSIFLETQNLFFAGNVCWIIW